MPGTAGTQHTVPTTPPEVVYFDIEVSSLELCQRRPVTNHSCSGGEP